MNRRLPFDDIALRLEREILPVAQEWGKELEHDFENVKIKVYANRADNHPRLTHQFSYHISMECSEAHESRSDSEVVILSVDLSQYDATSYPILSAFVGWLVDEESGGDWEIEPVAKLFPDNQEVHEGILEVLEKSLPSLYQHLRDEVKRRMNKPGSL